MQPSSQRRLQARAEMWVLWRDLGAVVADCSSRMLVQISEAVLGTRLGGLHGMAADQWPAEVSNLIH